MKKTVLLIDGDIISYRAAAAAEKKSIKVVHKSGACQTFNTRTEFKALLKEKNKLDKLQDYTIEDVQDPEPIEHVLHTIKNMIGNLSDVSFADTKEIYISGQDNFRNKLLLPTKYKGNRDNNIRPVHLEAAKRYLLDYQGAVRAKRIEADDVLSVRAYEELAKGNIPIIASSDKDTYQADGVFVYDFTKEVAEIVEIPVIGEVRLIKKNKNSSYKGEGLKFLAFQLLAGDKADSYCPYYLSRQMYKTVYGEASAYKALVKLDFQDEVLQHVIEQYKLWYPESFDYTAWDGTEVKAATWQTMLDIYFKCAWMKRSWTDTSDCKLEFSRRGVQIE